MDSTSVILEQIRCPQNSVVLAPSLQDLGVLENPGNFDEQASMLDQLWLEHPRLAPMNVASSTTRVFLFSICYLCMQIPSASQLARSFRNGICGEGSGCAFWGGRGLSLVGKGKS